MKYSNEIIINLPVGRVVELFDDPENLKKWQPGLVSFEPVSGVPGKPGAKSKLIYKMGKREIEMIETVTVRNLPQEFSGTYQAKGVYNEVRNYFVPTDINHTRYITDCEFRFSGFMKIMAFLMPGAFKKQTRKMMEQFKLFAEKQE
jgi:carbon monoxide dehydrogenase subunit G